MKILIITLVLFATQAKASCLEKETSLVSAKLVYQHCQMTEPLQFSHKSFYYPNISINDLSVDYWTGSFERENLYQIEAIEILRDTCQQKEVYRKKTQKLDRDFDEFKMLNPNLDEKIQDPSLTRPLADKEAQLGFQKLKLECEKIKN